MKNFLIITISILVSLFIAITIRSVVYLQLQELIEISYVFVPIIILLSISLYCFNLDSLEDSIQQRKNSSDYEN